MSEDKNKSYSDGLNGQPWNGRNWDEYAAGRSMSIPNNDNTHHTQPKKSTDSWEAPKPFVGNSEPMTDRQARTLFLIPIVILGIAVVPAAACLSLPLAFVLKKIEAWLHSSEKRSYISAYLTTVKALSAYGLAYIGTGVIVYLLGRFIITGGRLSMASHYLGNVTYAVLHGFPISFAFLSGTMLLLQIPSLLAFACVLRRDRPAVFAGWGGFWKAGLTAVFFAALLMVILAALYRLIQAAV